MRSVRSGSGPVSRLRPSARCRRSVRSPSEAGIGPDRSLLASFSEMR